MRQPVPFEPPDHQCAHCCGKGGSALAFMHTVAGSCSSTCAHGMDVALHVCCRCGCWSAASQVHRTRCTFLSIALVHPRPSRCTYVEGACPRQERAQAHTAMHLGGLLQALPGCRLQDDAQADFLEAVTGTTGAKISQQPSRCPSVTANLPATGSSPSSPSHSPLKRFTWAAHCIGVESSSTVSAGNLVDSAPPAAKSRELLLAATNPPGWRLQSHRR